MPLLRIKQVSLTPPGYWRMPRDLSAPFTTDPKAYIFGGDLQDLVKNIIEFRVINNLPLGDPEAECQDWLCRQAPGPLCVPANPARLMPGVRAKAKMVTRFLYAMGQWMLRGGHVEQEEAERRAELCASCPWNVYIDDASCLGCFGATEKIMKIIGGRQTRLDGSLRYCGRCGCSNAVSVWVPMDILSRAHKLEEFPDDIGAGLKCWKREYAESQKA